MNFINRLIFSSTVGLVGESESGDVCSDSLPALEALLISSVRISSKVLSVSKSPLVSSNIFLKLCTSSDEANVCELLTSMDL